MLKDLSREAEFAAEAEVPTVGEAAPVDLAKINTLHELLALALDDFEKVIADRRFMPNMNIYHAPGAAGACHVCLAGGVMAMSLGCGDRGMWTTHSFGGGVRERLLALDRLRRGSVDGALEVLGKRRSRRAETIARKWVVLLDQSSFAQGRRDSRRLLSKLRVMQRELAETGL